MKKKVFIVLMLAAFAVIAQHNSAYTQYVFNGLLLNPAYAGSNDALNLTSLYRKQWIGMDGSPTTITFSGHMPLKNRKLNFGMVLVNDKFGVSEHNKVNLVYAYRIKLAGGDFSFGLQAGIDAYRANWDQVKTTQQRDPSFVVNADKKILPQAGFGVYYYRDRFYAGASVPSLIGINLNRYQTAVLTAGCVFDLSEDIKVKPALLVKYVISSPVDANLSSSFYYKNIIGLGVGCSLNGTSLVFMDLKCTDQLRLGYSYDYMFSDLKNYTTGSHEIMLRYLFQYKVRVSSARYF